MVDFKNDGVDGNVLSDLDFGTVLRDSHNVDLNAIDVNNINSLVPERYSRIAYTYKDMGDGTKEVEYIKFYSQGTKEISKVDIRSNPHGTAEISTFGFSTQTTTSLDGKYIILYDDIGSVGVWFDLDNLSTPPTTGATRDIQVDITTGDTTADFASKFATTLNSDSKFTGTPVTTAAIIQSSTVGNKTNATQGNTTIVVSVTDGIDSLNSKYYLLYSGKDRTEYYLWYNIDTNGIDPALVGKTGIEVVLTGSDIQSLIASKEASVINAVEDFIASSTGDTVTITNAYYGSSSNITDVDTNNTFTLVTEGVSGGLVAVIRTFFDENNLITNIERIS